MKKSISATAFKRAKSSFVTISLPLSFFALLTILMLILAFVAQWTLLLTVPFIIVPAFFSVAALNTLVDRPEAPVGVGFFVMFRGYFSQPFRGGFRVIFGLLKFFFVYLIVSLLLTVILTNTVLNKDPAYLAFIESSKTMTDAEFIDATAKFISENASFKMIMFVTTSAGLLGGTYMFLHHITTGLVKYNYNFLSKLPLPTQDLNVIHKAVMKKNRAAFNKDYYKVVWFLALIFIGGYALGTLIPYFFLPQISPLSCPVIGLFVAFILLLFFIPYLINGMQLIFEKYRSEYTNTFIELSMKSIEEIKKHQEISEEKEKEILQFLESQKPDENKKDDNQNK